MTDRYWLSTPGSKEPPRGPMPLDTVVASWNSGGLHADTTMCKVGDATWLSVARVLGPPKAPEVQPAMLAGPVVSPVSSPFGSGPLGATGSSYLRSLTEARYRNLAGVGDGLSTWGGILKVLGFVIFGAGVLGIVVGLGTTGWIVGVGAFGLLVGIIVAVLGMLVAAVGEALLAIRDIAVNTRIVADLTEK